MLWLDIDRSSGVTLTRQVYEALRAKILSGELRAGERLPSTRELARTLGVSRNVVLGAYDQLVAEGFVESRPGAGNFVAEGALLGAPRKYAAPQAPSGISLSTGTGEIIDFKSGIPALELFPRKKWAGLLYGACMDTDFSRFGYGEPEGALKLRQVLGAYLFKTRGVYCEPGQIIVTTGAVQALALAARLLLEKGELVAAEDPSNHDLQRILTATGALLHPVPVDDKGILTELLPEGAKLIYLTPSHQFPMGGILPIQRRIEIINYAREQKTFILEDDYDSEFRHEGLPVSSIQGLEPERVIYVGTFSKIMFPALRIGYMVLPRSLARKCALLKRRSDYHTPLADQLALAGFIESGLLERHVAKMRKLYGRRRKKLIECLEQHFHGRYRVEGEAAGIHLVVEFGFKPDSSFLRLLKGEGVRIYPVEVHAALKGRNGSKFIMGYGGLSEEQLAEGVLRIKRASDKYLCGKEISLL